MPTENMEVWKTARATHERYEYFLMALTVAAIGFAVQRTSGRYPQWSMIPLVGAGVSWGLSLFAGLRCQEWISKALKSLYIIITPPPNKEEREQAEKESEKADCKTTCWRRVQFYAFLLGAAFFIAWHVWDMFQNGKVA